MVDRVTAEKESAIVDSVHTAQNTSKAGFSGARCDAAGSFEKLIAFVGWGGGRGQKIPEPLRFMLHHGTLSA